MLLVSDASQEYTEPEVQLLRHAMRISPNVAAVLAKTDLYPEWRTIERIDRGHLKGIGDMPIFAVSSDLRLLAAAEQDRELNSESGFPALVAHLRSDVLARAEAIGLRSAVHDLTFVLEQMTVSVRSELTAILHPEDTPTLIAELEHAKARATGAAAVTSLVAGIRRLNHQLGIPELIVEEAVAQDEFREAVGGMAASALEDGCTPSNPVRPTREDLVLLLRKLG